MGRIAKMDDVITTDIVREGWDEVLELDRIGVRFKEDNGTCFIIYMPAQSVIVALFKGKDIQQWPVLRQDNLYR